MEIEMRKMTPNKMESTLKSRTPNSSSKRSSIVISMPDDVESTKNRSISKTPFYRIRRFLFSKKGYFCCIPTLVSILIACFLIGIFWPSFLPPFSPINNVDKPNNESLLFERILRHQNISLDQVAPKFCSNPIDLIFNLADCQINWTYFAKMIESKFNAKTEVYGINSRLIKINNNAIWIFEEPEQIVVEINMFIAEDFEMKAKRYFAKLVLPLSGEKLLLVTSEMIPCVITLTDPELQCQPI